MENAEAKRMLHVFFFLSAGPVRLDLIREKLFLNPLGKMVSRQYFQRFMDELMREDYIMINQYKDPRIANRAFKVATIQHRGAEYLAEKMPEIDPGFIRKTIPQRNQIRHELILSFIIRSLREECLQKKYKIDDLYDESTMKSLRKFKIGARKGFYLPDIVMRITTCSGIELEFILELDCASKGRTYWSRKLTSFIGFSLIISLSKIRMMQLCGYVNNIKMDGMMIFTTLEDFKKVGLSFFIERWLNQDHKKDKYLVNPPAQNNKKEEVVL